MNVDKTTFLETLEIKSAMSTIPQDCHHRVGTECKRCDAIIDRKIKAIREKYNEKRKKETLLGG